MIENEIQNIEERQDITEHMEEKNKANEEQLIDIKEEVVIF